MQWSIVLTAMVLIGAENAPVEAPSSPRPPRPCPPALVKIR